MRFHLNSGNVEGHASSASHDLVQVWAEVMGAGSTLLIFSVEHIRTPLLRRVLS